MLEAGKAEVGTLSISHETELAVPSRQKGFAVTGQQWRRLKDRVRSISPQAESRWFAGGLFCAGSFVAFLIGAISLDSADGVSSTVLTLFYCVATGFGVAVVPCAIGFAQSRGQRRSDVDFTIDMMEEVEAGFTSPESADASSLAKPLSAAGMRSSLERTIQRIKPPGP